MGPRLRRDGGDAGPFHPKWRAMGVRSPSLQPIMVRTNGAASHGARRIAAENGAVLLWCAEGPSEGTVIRPAAACRRRSAVGARLSPNDEGAVFPEIALAL